MSKKGRRTRRTRRERVAPVNATPVRRATRSLRVTHPILTFRPSPVPTSPILQLEDRREWHPEREYKPVRAIRRAATQIVATKPSRLHSPVGSREILAFADPTKVSICARREIRKRVLHALGKSGRNGQRSRRLNAQSQISCKR